MLEGRTVLNCGHSDVRFSSCTLDDDERYLAHTEIVVMGQENCHPVLQEG